MSCDNHYHYIGHVCYYLFYRPIFDHNGLTCMYYAVWKGRQLGNGHSYFTACGMGIHTCFQQPLKGIFRHRKRLKILFTVLRKCLMETITNLFGVWVNIFYPILQFHRSTKFNVFSCGYFQIKAMKSQVNLALNQCLCW